MNKNSNEIFKEQNHKWIAISHKGKIMGRTIKVAKPVYDENTFSMCSDCSAIFYKGKILV